MQAREGKNLKSEFIPLMQAKILSGELKPGDRLPPERELALQVGISRRFRRLQRSHRIFA